MAPSGTNGFTECLLEIAHLLKESVPAVVEVLGVGEDAGPGTGFVVRESGLIVTCAHVVGPNSLGTQVAIWSRPGQGPVFHPGRVVVLGKKEGIDLALIQIGSEKKDWPALQLGEGKNLEVKRLVVAIGFPTSGPTSPSLGMVSAPNQRIQGMDIIPINIAVNPGNSGGPLLSLDGSVVGIVSHRLKSKREDGYIEGIAYAIAVEELRKAFGLLDCSVAPDAAGGLSLMAGYPCPAAPPTKETERR